MIKNLFRGVIGTANERYLKSLNPIVQQVNLLEEKYQDLSDDEIRGFTQKFRDRLAAGEKLDELLPEAFATVREAAKRTLGMRHYDVQLIGGCILHKGMIAEMKTGEGKTLVATLAAYLNALSGKGVHVITVNDYLARRDAEWMGQVYEFLGLTVGCVYSGMRDVQKKEAYAADITYGQNNEFGFDYLRDNLKFSADDLIQREHAYAIIDEVDSILIDEARTPLIISGPAEDSSELYLKVNKILPNLKAGEDYDVDLKSKQPTLNEAGVAHAEELLGIENLYDPTQIEVLHHVNQSLKAHSTMQRDVDYVVKDGQVIIVDEFTGRLMSGRRWSDGLHQAVEAKEGVKIARENVTLASITFQNLFRLYGKLSGMTGTALTEATEFQSIYKLDVTVIPTNLPLARIDQPDVIYRTKLEKYEAAAEEIIEEHATGRPILVGTTNIEQSELMSRLLKEKSVPHHVLNAKHHEQEAQIVAQAGRLGAVTIATNMAGRGTDIVLGGNPESQLKDRMDPEAQGFAEALAEQVAESQAEKQKVLHAGGLYIIGTERHESRRIDNQLRGRAGRQGDPGQTKFYISLEDDLMQRFGGDRHVQMMKKMGWKEGMAIDNRLITRMIENAQSRVERYHFEGRKQVTEYDDVLNKQRQVVYGLRNKALHSEGIREAVLNMVDDLIEDSVMLFCAEEAKPALWKRAELTERFEFLFNFKPEKDLNDFTNQQNLFDYLREAAKNSYQSFADYQQEILDRDQGMKEQVNLSLNDQGTVFDYKFSTVEQETILETLDHHWNNHLQAMDFMREGIGLRGYAQKNPLHEYQREGFELFSQMLDRVNEEVVRKLFFFDASQFRDVINRFVEEQQRRAEMEEQLKLQATAQVSESDDKVAGFAPKDPEAERQKMQERKRQRRRRR